MCRTRVIFQALACLSSLSVLSACNFTVQAKGPVSSVTSSETAYTPPTATPQKLAVNDNSTAQVILAGSSVANASLSFSIVANPAHGVLSGTAPNLVYTPNLPYNGQDSFTFVVSDGTQSSTPATVSITVNHVNRAPNPPVSLTCPTTPYMQSAANVCTLVPASIADPDGDSVTYADAGSTCPGVQVNATTGGVAFTAPSANATCLVMVSASDGSLSSTPVSSATITGTDNLAFDVATAPTFLEAPVSFSTTVTPSWTLATSPFLSSQSIQFYSDTTCNTPVGSAVSMSAAATSTTFTGVNSNSYSFIVTSFDSAGGSAASSCSASVFINTSACVGTRLTQTPFAGGSGTASDPYLICTAAQLNSIGTSPGNLSANYKLLANIDLTGVSWNLIGSFGNPFSGVFYGNSKTVSNLVYSSQASTSGVGMFGANSGTVQSLNLASESVTGLDNVGGVAGYSSGTLSLVTATGTFTGRNRVGGVAGNVTGGSVVSAFAGGLVSGSGSEVGGIIGLDTGANVTSSGSNAAVTGGSVGAGGLIGEAQATPSANFTEITIQTSYSTGAVVGVSAVGGLIGAVDRVSISNSYSRSTVTGNSRVGGFEGFLVDTGGPITDCYESGVVTLLSGGIFAGTFVGDDSTDVIGGPNIYVGDFWNTAGNSGLYGSGSGGSGATAGTGINNNPPGHQFTTSSTFTGAGWSTSIWEFPPNLLPDLNWNFEYQQAQQNSNGL